MTAKTNGPSSFIVDGNYGSEAGQKVWNDNKEWLNQGMQAIANAAAAGDSGALILIDSALLSLAQTCRDYLSRLGVQVQALPSSLGDELSLKIQ
jgi:hypothetical protein